VANQSSFRLVDEKEEAETALKMWQTTAEKYDLKWVLLEQGFSTSKNSDET
jgi:hypothetical protein